MSAIREDNPSVSFADRSRLRARSRLGSDRANPQNSTSSFRGTPPAHLVLSFTPSSPLRYPLHKGAFRREQSPHPTGTVPISPKPEASISPERSEDITASKASNITRAERVYHCERSEPPPPLYMKTKKRRSFAAFFIQNYSETTLTNFLLSALRSNLTLPSTSANSVSSLPMPTPVPG